MHVIQSLSKLLGMTHKTIPKLMLPKRSFRVAGGVEAKGCYLFRVMQHFGNRQRIGGPDEGVPMIGHQHVAAEEKLKAESCCRDHVDQQWILVLSERLDHGLKVDVRKEKTVGNEQAVNVRHVFTVALPLTCSKYPRSKRS